MRKFYLITNSSGCKYWSYKVGRDQAPYLPMTQAMAVEKHGDIYVNQCGGWMTSECAVTIHKVVESKDFPLSA
jgi:hypothetical protein